MSDHSSNKDSLDVTTFKSVYIATFLASYMATKYDEHCLHGHPNQPYLSQPVEDASFLANCAWDSIQNKL